MGDKEKWLSPTKHMPLDPAATNCLIVNGRDGMVNLLYSFLFFFICCCCFFVAVEDFRRLSPVHFGKLYLITLFLEAIFLVKISIFFLSKCDACQGYGTFIRSSWRSILFIILCTILLLRLFEGGTSAKINDRSRFFGLMN